jgi:hypothetical protein
MSVKTSIVVDRYMRMLLKCFYRSDEPCLTQDFILRDSELLSFTSGESPEVKLLE